MIRDCETHNRSPFQLFREVFISSRRASFALLLPSGRKSALAVDEHPEPVEIIRQIPQANLRPGPCLANRAQYQVASFLRLNPKDMFNARANLRPRPIATLLPFCQLAIAATFALYMFPVSFFRQIAQLLFRAISRVCPYVAARVGSIKQQLKHFTVVNCGICHRISANQLVLNIHDNMILVAERALAMLLDPTSIGILLALLVLLPIGGNFSGLDLCVFLSTIALLGHAYDAGVNNLALSRLKATFSKMAVKLLKQFVDDARRYQVFSESPHRRCVRHLTAQMESKKPAERVTVEYLKLQRLVREVVQGLEDQNLEHQDNVIRFGPGGGFLLLAPGFLKLWPKYLPIDGCRNFGKRGLRCGQF